MGTSVSPLHLPAFGIGVPCHSPSFPVPWATLRALSPLAFKSSHLSASVLCSSLAFRLPVSVCLSSLPLSLSSFPSGANHPTPTHFVSLGLCCYPQIPSPHPYSLLQLSPPSPPPPHIFPPPSRLLCPLPVTCLSPSSPSFSGAGLLTDSSSSLGRRAWQHWRSPMDDSRARASLGAVTKEITHHRLKFKLEFR